MYNTTEGMARFRGEGGCSYSNVAVQGQKNLSIVQVEMVSAY